MGLCLGCRYIASVDDDFFLLFFLWRFAFFFEVSVVTSRERGVATLSPLGEAFVWVGVGSGGCTKPGVMGSSVWWAVTTGVAMRGSSVFCAVAIGVACVCTGTGTCRRFLLLGVSSNSLRLRRTTLHRLRFMGFEGAPVAASFRIAANTSAHTPVASDLSSRNFGIIQIFRIIGFRQLTTLYRNPVLMVWG